MNDERPVIAVSAGDPNGVGPELAVRLLNDPETAGLCRPVFYGPECVLREAARRFAPGKVPDCVDGAPEFTLSMLNPGVLDPRAGKAACESFTAAVRAVLAGKADAVVTCPINKAAVNACGIPFTGHTELAAELCGCRDFAMMQSAGNLRVVFATTHIALAEVSRAVTRERIIHVARLLEDAAKADGIESPAIAVAGLNPHAGENGNMGREDEEVVKPAVAELKKSGMNVSGPYPSDTLFVERIRNQFDGIVAMYHDQGHIPFKMLAFDRGVNSTLGLPIIRTSVDHGTAFDIAWKGLADSGSLKAALRIAVNRAARKKAKH